MKIAIMQPYLFPYIGYFQLMKEVELFGIGDDVQYIKGGWINRNRILAQNKPKMFTFSLKKDSSKEIIKNRLFSDNFLSEKEKFLRVLALNYKRAPYFHDTMNLLNKIFDSDEKNISRFIENHLRLICDYLEISIQIIPSNVWQIESDNTLRVQERAVLKLKNLKSLGANHFINPIGGKNIYTKDFFQENGFILNFLKTNDLTYDQWGNEFVSNLSIIDVLMFNSKTEIIDLLTQYELV